MVLHTTEGVQEILSELRVIAQQVASAGSTEFNVLHVGLSQRSIYRSGMHASLSTSAAVLESLQREGHIRWTSRGIGVDTFILMSSPPQMEHD